MAERDEIELGYRVKDKISGFEGIVTDIGSHLTGCERYGVHPADRDTSAHRGDEEFFYAAQLEVVDDDTDFVEFGEQAVTETGFDLGERVKDEVTGVEGYATTITVNLFNCPRVAIQPVEPDDDTEDLDRSWQDTPRVERVDGGIAPDFEELIQNEATAQTGSEAVDVERQADLG